jgi:hypothetical protein
MPALTRIASKVATAEFDAGVVAHLDPGHRGEMASRAHGQIFVGLDRDDAACRAYAVRHQRRVVAEAASHVQDARPVAQIERVDERRHGRRKSVVELARRVDRHSHVVTHATGIAIWRQPRSETKFDRPNEPGPRRQEPLARHAGQRFDERSRAKAGLRVHFFSEVAAVRRQVDARHAADYEFMNLCCQ